MSDIFCPKCGHTGPVAATVGRIRICEACGGTLYARDSDGAIRPATFADIDHLTPAEKQTLKVARRGLVSRAEGDA